LPDLQINAVDKSQITNGIVSIALVVNAYLHLATSKTVGLSDKKK
jgi:hypothetical protein